MEKKEKGKFYKDTTLQSKNWRMMIWTAPLTYLVAKEMPAWLMILKYADWTVFKDGTFCISQLDAGMELGTCKKTAMRSIDSLDLIGFIKAEPAGPLGKKITINYDGLDKLCSIIQKNPGIGPYLRKVRGDSQHIDFIKDAELEAAKKLMEETKMQLIAEKKKK